MLRPSIFLRGALLALLLVVQGCASVPYPHPRDPMESLNRNVFAFNDALDQNLVQPVASAYQRVTPRWVRSGVSNFFNNIQDMWSVVNNALTLRGQATGESLARVMVNTTLGLGGLVDVATDLDLERHNADFGLTLGRWGAPAGPYVVLPVLGPSTVRGVAAIPANQAGNLVNQVHDEPSRLGLVLLDAVNTRASLLQAGNVLEEAALDKYSFVRDSYLQRLRNRVYDGNPPDEDMD